MDLNVASKEIADNIFAEYSKTVQVVIRGTKTKSPNYDKYRDTGFVQTTKNPIFVKAIIKQIASNSLIIREMGLTETGAIQIIIKDSDLSYVKLSKEILYLNNEYYIYNDAVGSKIQVTQLPFGYSKVILFRKDI